MEHLGEKHRLPLRNNFDPSRLQNLQTGPVYLAILLSVPYTLLRFLGLQPLCGTGVISFITPISIPLDMRALMDASRPLPGPFV